MKYAYVLLKNDVVSNAYINNYNIVTVLIYIYKVCMFLQRIHIANFQGLHSASIMYLFILIQTHQRFVYIYLLHKYHLNVYDYNYTFERE